MNVRRWTEDHGDDGLRPKFAVYKTRAGTPIGHLGKFYADADQLGADGEFIFVLRPETDEEACVALASYARMVRHRAPQLADDIAAQVERICLENGV